MTCAVRLESSSVFALPNVATSETALQLAAVFQKCGFILGPVTESTFVVPEMWFMCCFVAVRNVNSVVTSLRRGPWPEGFHGVDR